MHRHYGPNKNAGPCRDSEVSTKLLDSLSRASKSHLQTRLAPLRGAKNDDIHFPGTIANFQRVLLLG